MKTKKNRNNLALGIVLAAIGALLLLNNLLPQEIPFKYYIFSWKTLLIFIGLALIVIRKHYIAGVIVASIGVVFWLPAIFNFHVALNQIMLPAILVITGAVLLMKAAGLDNCKKRRKRFTPYEEIETVETTVQNS